MFIIHILILCITVDESAELLDQQNAHGIYDNLETLASSTQLIGDDNACTGQGPPALLSMGGDTAEGVRSPIAPNHVSTLHPATKSEAQAAITIDAALAAGAPRDTSDDSPITPVEEVHLHTARELSVYYRQACRARDERPIESVLRQLKVS